MSYNIQYNIGSTYRLVQSKKKSKNGICWSCGILFAVIVGYYLLSKSGVSLLSILLPGATEETALAVENMVINISEGASVIEAVKTFCIQVVNYAK